MATGNSKAAKSARVKLQLRDKKGRWIEMGGGVKWYSPNLGKYMFGTAVDATPEGLAVVEVKNPNSQSAEKIFTVNIPPSQLEKIYSKASITPGADQVIKPEESKAKTPAVAPVAEKNNKIFEDMHKNGASHDEPFGPDYEKVPFDPKGVNNLQKSDLVTYYSEGVFKKGHVIGTDQKSGNPIIQPEVSSNWGFGGHGKITPLDKITDLYKPKDSSPSNAGGTETKADVPVPSVDKLDPKQIAKNLSGPSMTAEEKAQTEKDIAAAKDVKANSEKYLKNGVPTGLSKKSVIANKQKEEESAAAADAQEKKDAKLSALMSAKTGTRMLSADEKTINLVKQDAGYWTEEGTGKNYTSTQVVEQFAGEKGVSLISPPPEPLKPGELSSSMSNEEFKNNLPSDMQEKLADTNISSPYTPASNAFKSYPGYNEIEEEAIMDYVGDSSMLNSALRLDNSNVKTYSPVIAGMDSILDKSALTEPITVWRGIRATPELFDNLMNHGTYKDAGFSATSLSEQVARNWVKGGMPGSTNKPVTLKIELPTGFKAHKVDYSAGFGGIESFDEEDEVVLPRNTMFKVVSMEQNANNSGYTAIVQPVLTKHNSIEGAKNDGSNTSTGDTGTKADTNIPGNESGGESQALPNDSGNDNVSNGGPDSSGDKQAEPGTGNNGGSDSGDQTGPITDSEEPKEVGKLYTDDKGQYMLGDGSAKFRNGDTVSYTKKGVTQEGKIVALYEGVKSARVEFPDGTKSVKKINTLKSAEKPTEADIAPVDTNPTPQADVPSAPDAIEVPQVVSDFDTPADSFDKAPFDSNLSTPIADLPLGTVIKLSSNEDHALMKIGDDSWAHSQHPEQQIGDSAVSLAMGLKNNGKPSYNIYMPKNDVATVDTPEVQDTPATDLPSVDVAPVEEKKSVTDNFQVTANMNGTPGSFHVKTKDNSAVSVSIADLKEGDVLYPVGSQSKPYGTHNNYAANQVYIDTKIVAGKGTVVKNDPSKPYVQVQGEDGEMYFPSKHFVATKQSDEIDKLIGELSPEAKQEAVEETATPEELTDLENATAKAPVDVSNWKKLKNSSGSNPGGEYEAPDGTHFFIKQSKSDLHAKNEILASDIYQAAGLDSLELGYADVNGSGKLGTIAPMISGAKNNLQSKLSSDPEYKKQFQKGWAVDAWLGNWDVVGLAYDNAVTDDQGKAIRVDPGGALLFRAMGSPKSDAMFGDSVGEWDSMRTDPNNYQTNDAFGDMTDAQIKESVAIVAGFTDKMIDDLVDKHDFDGPTADKLKTRLKNRRDDLIARANKLPGDPIEPKKAQEDLTPTVANTDDNNADFVTPTGDSTEVTTPSDTTEPPLADWEKELLEGVIKEKEDNAKADQKEAEAVTPDLASMKPGTIYQLTNGQDAVVGKYNTEIAYGVTVDYFKKNEKKTGTVANIMTNQQSAKVVWADGSSSIIKGSQLVGKGKPDTNVKTNTDNNSSAPIKGMQEVLPEAVPVEKKKYVIDDWNDENPYSASDYPVGSNLNWKTDDNAPTDYGWEKIGDNDWISVSSKNDPHPTHFVDTDIDEAKNPTYKMYVPADVADSIAAIDTTAKDTVDVKESTSASVPTQKMNWLQQDGKPNQFPIGTKLSVNNNQVVYTKTADDNWLVSASYGNNTYPDSDMQTLDKEETDVILPDGFSFFEPGEKTAADHSIGTTLNKGPTVITKIDDQTWETKSGISYTNGEIDILSMPSTWIIKEHNSNEDVKKENTKDLFTQVEEASNIFSKTYESYVQNVGEENSSWDEFASEFGDYLPDEENNSVEINGQNFFFVPDYSSGPDYKVKITDEFGKTHGTVSANSGYGSFDSYYLNSKLDDAVAKIANSMPEDKKDSGNTGLWNAASPSTESMPTGSKVIGQTITLTKKDDGDWVSSTSGQVYTSTTVENLKATDTHDYGWKFEVPAGSAIADVVEPDTSSTLVEKMWDTNLPSAAEMPIGSQISTGVGAGKLVFEKMTDNAWSPTEGSTGIKHTDATMESLKGNTWKVAAPASAFETKPEPVVPENTTSLGDFSNEFDSYFSKLPGTPWSSFKGTELEFEVNGQKFTFAPHPMSSSFSPYMQLQSNGKNVFSENDFEIDGGEPYKFTAADVYEAAKTHAETFAANKKPTVPQADFTLGEGKTLADVSYEEFVAVPAGTQIDYITNGKVYGTYQKNSNNSWRFQGVNKDKPSHKSESNDDFKFFMESNKAAAGNYVIKAPNAPEVPEEEVLVQSEKPKFVFQHQTIDDKSTLVNYPVGTSIKIEQSSWQNTNGSQYYVKKENGDWTKFQKTPSTVSEKNTLSTDGLFSTLSSWYKTPVAISIPTGTDGVLIGSGEHAYIGDTVIAAGKSYTLEKINKTALNLIDMNGNKVKIPAKKLSKDATFGVKDNTINNSNSSASAKYDLNTVSPVSAFVEAKQAEEAVKNKLINFAGASASDYDAKGLGLPISINATKPKNTGLSVISVDPANTSSPLYGAPQPTMPVSPQDYPSFEEAVLDNLPKWDSAEWLKAVEERYIANPNKKFANVQKSTQWGKIEEVLKGNQGYSSYLNQLLSNKYIDQDLYDMAEKAIKEQEKVNKPLKKAHQDNIVKEKAEYEAKKLAYMTDYNNEVDKYTKDMEEWSKVNTKAGDIKKLPKIPELTVNPFTGGPADWTKSHPGTHAVQTIMDAMRNDNLLARFGLGAAVDSDKIEETAVSFGKVKDMNGVEKFEVTFKLTNAFGEHMANKLKADPTVDKSTGIWYSQRTDMSKKPDDQLAKLMGKPSNSSFVNSGTRFEYNDDVSGAKVTFQHAAQTGQNVSVNHNSVQILLDVNATPADFQLALENMGIDAKPATAGALRVVAENKLLSLFSGESNWGDENFSGSKREKALEKVKTNFNITADDVVVETDANGLVKFFLTDAKVEEFMSKSKIKEFKHSIYAGEDIDVWESILSGANPGLAANYYRGSKGIGVLKSGTGMSPDKDMAVGSGAGVFITPHSTKEKSAPYYNFIGIDRKNVMRRLDMWGNAHDNYGKNDKGAPTPFHMMKNQSGFHEVMPRDTIPVSDFAWVTIGSVTAKKKLIERLTAKGIFMINGLPLEKFILTNNEDITPIPVTNVIGADIAPSGAAGAVV